jgi:hypothetical protein
VTSYSLSTAVLDNPATGSGTTTAASTTPGRIVASPLNYHTPYVQQFSLDIQHVFTPTFMIDAGYFGTHGTHLLGMLEINQPQPNAWVGKVSIATPEPPELLVFRHSSTQPRIAF